jgi:hypothetical protein
MGLTMAVGPRGGALLVLWDSRWSEASKRLIETPEALVWILAIAILTATWALTADRCGRRGGDCVATYRE